MVSMAKEISVMKHVMETQGRFVVGAGEIVSTDVSTSTCDFQ